MAMDVEYRLAFEDMLAWERYQRRIFKAALGAGGGPASWVVGAVLGLAVSYWIVEPDSFLAKQVPAFLVGIVIGTIGLLLLAQATTKRRIGAFRRQFEDGHSRWMLGWRRLRIGPEGYSTTGDGFQAATDWANVMEVVTTAAHVFLILSWTQAIVVPRRAFADPKQFEEFAALAQSFHARRDGFHSAGVVAVEPLPSTDIQTRDHP
jgi:hypothetical protein